MEEMIIGIGADNKKLIQTLNQSATSVDKFLSSKEIKDLRKLKINIDKANFDKTLKDYEKNVSGKFEKLTKKWFAFTGNGKAIDLGIDKEIKNALELDKALAKLKKNREGIYSNRGKVPVSNVDSIIRKLELAKKSVLDLNKYLSINEKAGTSLLQSMISISNLENNRGKVTKNSTINELQKQLELQRRIHSEYQKMNRITANKGFNKELSKSRAEIDMLTKKIKDYNAEQKRLSKESERLNKLDSQISQYKKIPTNEYEAQKKAIQEILATTKQLNAVIGGGGAKIKSITKEYERELAAVNSLIQKERERARYSASKGRIDEYTKLADQSQNTNIARTLEYLRRIKSEYDSISRRQGGKFLDNQDAVKYEQLLRRIELTKKRISDIKLQKKEFDVQSEISRLKSDSTMRDTSKGVDSIKRQRSELKKLISLYEKLHKIQRQRGNRVDTSGLTKARQDLFAIERQLSKINKSSLPFASTLGHLFGGYQIARFARTIAETTGYFQAQKIAMESILQDAGEAQKIFNQLKDFSLKSPFEFKDLLTQTKQLSAFQIPAEELFETTKRLGDLSAGLGVDMNRLILAYGQVRSAAFLRGQEVRQFTEAGVPLVQALADKFTVLEGRVVSTGEVFERISKRMVSFEMVKDVLWDLTDETGKFYNMQEVLAGTVQGRILNLKDAWNQALESIGSDRVNVINGVLKILASMLENVRFWMASIVGVGFAYIINRISNSLKGFNKVIRSAGGGLKGFGKALKGFSIGGWLQIIAVVGSAIAGLISNINHKKNELKKALAEIADSFDKETKRLVNSFNKLANDAVSAGDGTEKQLKALEQIKSQYKDYIPLLDLEIEKIRAMRGEYELLTQAIENAQEAKKIQAQKEEVNRKAIEDYFGNEGLFSTENIREKLEKTLGAIMSGAVTLEKIKKYKSAKSQLGNELFSREISKSLQGNLKNVIESGDFSLDNFLKAAQKTLNLYIDNANYDIIERYVNQSARELHILFSESEYKKEIDSLDSLEKKRNPLKKQLDAKTEYYDKERDKLPVAGLNADEQFHKKLDIASKEADEKLKIFEDELTKKINDATVKKNLGENYDEMAANVDTTVGFINEIQDLIKEVNENKDQKTTRDEDIKALVDKIKERVSQTNNVDPLISNFYQNFLLTLQNYLNYIGYLEEWQKDANAVIDKYSDNGFLKQLRFTQKQSIDGEKERKEAGKKLQKEYDDITGQIAKYQTDFDKSKGDQQLKAILDAYKNQQAQLKEYADAIKWKLEEPKSSGGGRRNDYESDYNKRLSALQAFVKKYTELLKTYSHEKAIEILQGDKDGLISQFVTTNAETKASRDIADKNSTEYRAGFGGYRDWNEEGFINDSSKLKEYVDAVVNTEIKWAEQLLKANRISKSAISELHKIKKDLANIGIEEAFERLQNVLNENARKLEHNNNIADFFNTLTSLGVSPTEAAEISSYAGGIMGLYGSKVNNKKSEIRNLMKETGLGNFNSFDLSNIGGIEGAISKVYKMGTEYDSAGNKIYAEKTIKDLINLLEELKRLRQDDITAMYEIANKYSIVAQQQARENEADKQKAVSNGTTMDFATDLLKVANIGDANSLMKGIYGNLNAIDFTKQNENDQAFIKNYDEQMKFFFGDFSNVSGNMIRKLQNGAKVLREQLIETGQLTPQLAEYFDKLDLALIDASKGVKSFFENLSMEGTTRQDTANSMVDMIDALYKQGNNYQAAKIAFNNNKGDETAKKNFKDTESKLNTQIASITSFAFQNYKDPTILIGLVQKIFDAITSGNVNDIAPLMDETTSYAADEKNVSRSHQGADKRLAKLGDAKGDLEQLNGVIESGQNIIDAFSNAFSAVGDVVAAFGDKTEGATEAFEEIGYFMDDLSSAYGMISPLIGVIISIVSAVYVLTAAGYSLQAAFWPILIIGLALAAIAALVAGVMYACKKHDRDLEKQIEERKKQIEELQNEMKQLEWERDRSGDPFKNSAEILKNQAEQLRKQEEILKLEEGKKKKDEEAINETKAEIADDKRELNDMLRELRDNILGTSKDIAESLGNAFFDAFADGENAARAWNKSVKSIIGDAIKKALINKYLLPQVESVISKIFPEDEEKGFSGYEIFQNAEKANEELRDLRIKFTDIFHQLSEPLKEFLVGDGDNSLTSGIEGVTEETASIIAGYMNGVRETLVIQSGYVKSISVDVLAIREEFLPDIQKNIVEIATHTNSIDYNTSEILGYLKAITSKSSAKQVQVHIA